MNDTTRKRLHVLVIGGGIGGLALAQGLHKASREGADVSAAVYERDRTRTDRLQGYRVHVNPTGSRALHQVLPRPLYDAFVATAGRSGGGFTFATEQLRELLHIDSEAGGPPTDEVSRHHSVSRITLRQVLLAGLEEVVQFGKRFERYTTEPDGRVVAHFADGSTATGDVLVAADGARSRVRGQYLPHAELTDTGVVGIAGKTPLDDRTRALLPPLLYRNAINVIPPKRCGMFVAVQEFDREPVALPVAVATGAQVSVGGNDASAAAQPGLLFDNTRDYIMWAYAAPRSWYGPATDTDGMAPDALYGLAMRMIENWHPGLRTLVAESDLASVSTWPIRSSTPIEPWPTTTVTLLGDAIHSMTPMRGIGANIALRDACLLNRKLVTAARGEEPLLAAIGDYERQMTEYGFAAVRDSLAATRQFTGGAGARVGFKSFLRVANAVPPLKRKIFADPSDN